MDLTNEIHPECLWYCFSGVLQAYLNEVKTHWNTHYIRRSRHETIQGRPDSLFFLPEIRRGTGDLLLPVPDSAKQYVKNHLISQNETNDYQDYFSDITSTAPYSQPSSWQEALHLYEQLVHTALHGV